MLAETSGSSGCWTGEYIPRMSHEFLTKRVVADFTSAFRKNPNIDEFGFIYCPEKMVNKSPILVEGTKLGVESWCAKVVLPCIHKLLLCKRHSKDPQMLQAYTRVALLLNPECATFWNIRKELLQKKCLVALDELKFTNIVLTSHPKSPETFVHKRWVVRRILSEQSLNAGNHVVEAPLENQHLQEILRTEIEGSRLAASGYCSNYNAWSHRIWIVENLAQSSTEVLHSELLETEEWVRRHLSEHSGFQYRQFLLGKLDRADALLDEFHLIDELLTCFPGHEAVWNHRRALFHMAVVKYRMMGHQDGKPDHTSVRPKMARLEDNVGGVHFEPPALSEELNQNVSQVMGRVTSLGALVEISSERGRLMLLLSSASRSERTSQERHSKRYIEWLERFQT